MHQKLPAGSIVLSNGISPFIYVNTQKVYPPIYLLGGILPFPLLNVDPLPYLSGWKN